MADGGVAAAEGPWPLQQRLRWLTVKLRDPEKPALWGTGFFVTSDHLLTCWHVLEKAPLQRLEVVQKLQGPGDPEVREIILGEAILLERAEGLDLALLRFRPAEEPAEGLQPEDPERLRMQTRRGRPAVLPLQAEEPVSGTRLISASYPCDADGCHDSSFKAVGRTVPSGQRLEFLGIKNDQVVRGFSGSALVDQDCGWVCGVIARNDRPADPQSGLAREGSPGIHDGLAVPLREFALVFPAHGETIWQRNAAEAATAPGPDALADAKRLAQLDRWVEDHRQILGRRFEARQPVRDRRLHVPLKARIRLAGGEGSEAELQELQEVPAAHHFQQLVGAKGSQMLLIWEEGGAGKSSLAFQIARWGLEGALLAAGTSGARAGSRVLLPWVMDPAEGEGGLEGRLARYFTNLGVQPPQTLQAWDGEVVRELLRQRRLLLIVDHYSELGEQERRWVENNLPSGALVLLTSRLNERTIFEAQGWTVSELQPLRLQDGELFAFFDDYLKARAAYSSSSSVNLTAGDQMRIRELLERMVGNKPITVLLASMVIDRALSHIEGGGDDLLPSSVPELMRDYVERSGGDRRSHDWVLKDSGLRVDSSWILPCLKALALVSHRQQGAYTPQNFDAAQGLQALTNHGANAAGPAPHTVPLPEEVGSLSRAQRLDLLAYLEKTLNLLQAQGGSPQNPIYRLSLDPLADYLAALGLQEELKAGLEPSELWQEAHLRRVRTWLSELGQKLEDSNAQGPRMRGFLAAFRDCLKEALSIEATGEAAMLPLLEKWKQLPFEIARLAGIDPQEERRQEVRHLIRRHTGDLCWANPELRAAAIEQLRDYALEFSQGGGAEAGVEFGELEEALAPLARILSKAGLPVAHRLAAAEAMGCIGGGQAAKALVAVLNQDTELAVVRRGAAEALGLIAPTEELLNQHWRLLHQLLANGALHLREERDPQRISASVAVLQGAARGLQRLASGRFPCWGSGEERTLPMLSLHTAAGAVSTEVVERAVWQLPLPGGLALEVVEIPGGPWTIGSPTGEVGRDLYGHRPETAEVLEKVEAQRDVELQRFWMARFPLSQAQWRSLAGKDFEQHRPLNPDPAKHRGDDRPVECVSWFDCREWCERLTAYLALQLGKGAPFIGLPSESQWEAACRAGTQTPFHFGDTIDTAWANYDGNYVYPPGRAGAFLNETAPVGSYGLVNRWGLGDLHGGVWEWCQDLWHPDPLGGPKDGTAWEDPFPGLPENRLLRGGSWFNDPHDCRAAYRNSNQPGDTNDTIGVRPCCFLPQGSLLGS